jgi:DNA replication and repair protein RecF
LHLSEISNQGFRNLSSDPVFFSAGITLITGENAQGKTNLLEAAALVCGQRSFRGATSAAMARDGEAFSITGVFQTPARSGSDRMTVSWSREVGREFHRGEKTAGFREVSALAPAVFLAPEHRELLLGAPSARRRFLDRLVLGLKPAAGDDLARYGTALRERNALLARARRSGATNAHVVAPGELEAWTEELAVAGAAVRRHRRAALGLWMDEFEPLARGAGEAYRGVRAEYSAQGDSVEDLRAACQKLLPLERRRGYSLAGPHRDDLLWTRHGRPLAAEASSGEVARTVALVKLAEWSAVAKAAGEPPLFAADDFDAGLSEGWVQEFFDALPVETEVLLTTAAPASRFGLQGRASAVMEMRQGRAIPTPALRVVHPDAPHVVHPDAPHVVHPDAPHVVEA